MLPDPTIHDAALFEELLAAARVIAPEVRRGGMFGCPALYRGRKLAACVYGDVVGMKAPEAVAAEALRSGRAQHFRPYGKPAMREWIQIDGGAPAIGANLDLLAAALTFAESNNA